MHRGNADRKNNKCQRKRIGVNEQLGSVSLGPSEVIQVLRKNIFLELECRRTAEQRERPVSHSRRKTALGQELKFISRRWMSFKC